MSNAGVKEKKFSIAGPIADGDIFAAVDVGTCLYISYQIEAIITGDDPDVTFTVLRRNDKGVGWVETSVSMNMSEAGTLTDFLELDFAKSEHYAIQITIESGRVDGLNIYYEGK